ncbi:hypothetical protein V9T40_007630 [Parthenolecanium corni]|uniref:Phosphorylated adapter RNA export protein n=1 Tax=Parthenolecanium corni TaxID=536013 RepID=A0AAN9TK83_9HEMI
MNTSDWNEKPEDSQPKKVFQKSTRTKLRTRIGFTETASKTKPQEDKMNRTKYYRNPVMHYPRSEVGLGPNLSQTTRSIYKRGSTTPFSHSIKRPNTIYPTKHTTYSNPRFADQSKYVWTANKQQQQQSQSSSPSSQTTSSSTSTPTQVAAPQPSTGARVPPTPTLPSVQSSTQPTHTRIVSTVKKTPPVKSAVLHNSSRISRRELSCLNVTALDTPNAVAVDIASTLREDKFYVIKTVVDVLGVKKAIKLFYETRERELKGGILIQNGRRRRTPGGAYLALLRESSFIPKQEADKVFLEIKRFESRVNKNPHFVKF